MISTPQSEHFQLPLTISRGANSLFELYAMLIVDENSVLIFTFASVYGSLVFNLLIKKRPLNSKSLHLTTTLNFRRRGFRPLLHLRFRFVET